MTVPSNKKWAALFGVWILHGAIALWELLSLPADSRGFLFALSFQRALMGGVLLAWIIFSALWVVSAFQKSKRYENLLFFIQKPNARDVVLTTALFAVLARIGLALLRGLFEAAGNFSHSAYADRLAPLLNLTTFVSLEIIALILYFTFRNWKERKKEVQTFVARMALVLLPLTLISFFVYSTGWGIVPSYKGDWSRGIPAVALLEWQIILACAVCVGTLFLEARQKKSEALHLDLRLCLAIWLVAATLWLSQPVIPSPSALAPREPNFEIYPFIDAQVYDQFAQSVLIGNGYGDHEIPQRPLYIVFLILAHALVGQNYDAVIILQSLLLAFFPVLLYLFGKEFFGRPVGVAIALLAILRDYVSNVAAPFTGNLSYSKLYLSEIPTAIALILFLWIGWRWIKSGFPMFLGFWMGGILGVGMLIRTQVIVAFPILILFAFLTRPKRSASLLKSSLLGLVAVALVVSPWLARNWQMTGKLMFDNPASQTINLALRYSRLNGHNEINVMPLSGETNAVYNDRMIAIATREISSNPWGALKGVSSFFINHGINNILLFPLRYDLKSFSELFTPTNAFWQKWHGALNLAQTLLLAFYIFLFGLGVTVAWQRNGWLGFLPLGVNLAYNLWTSIALLSGQRFMLTMDWSIYLYYMLGLFALLSAFLFTLERGRLVIGAWYVENQFSLVDFADNSNWRKYFFTGIFFFGVGASLWLVETVFPQRYPLMGQDKIAQTIISSPSFQQSKLSATCFQKIIAKNKLHIWPGMALYPRYYWADDGERFTDAAGYKVTHEGRLVFEMVGQRSDRIIFPMSQPPDFFPNASDVALGVDPNDKIWFAFVAQGNVEKFYASDLFASACK